MFEGGWEVKGWQEDREDKKSEMREKKRDGDE